MGIDEWVVSVMEALGLLGVGLMVALENLVPPIPSEIILPLAGFTASRGEFTVAGAIIATTVGSVVGALVLYFLGRWLSADRLARIADRIPLMKGSDVHAAVAWFERFGPIAVLLGRFVPIVRSMISIPAGVTRMNIALFLLLTAIGSGVWNTVFILLGFALGENWALVEDAASTYGRVILALAFVALAGLIIAGVVRWRRDRRAANSVDAPSE
jgi:membrane protein DedA with SNARE-associated domain